MTLERMPPSDCSAMDDLDHEVSRMDTLASITIKYGLALSGAWSGWSWAKGEEPRHLHPRCHAMAQSSTRRSHGSDGLFFVSMV